MRMPDPVTLTIEDDDPAPIVTLVLSPQQIREDGKVSTVRAELESSVERGHDRDRLGGARKPGGGGRLHAQYQYRADHPGGEDGQWRGPPSR